MKPIASRKTTRELVYEQLKNGILNGTINRQAILTETELAKTLNTSRTPIREAIADLTNEGLLVHLPQKGSITREIKEHEIEQMFYLRNSIEMKGLSILVEEINQDEIEELKQVIALQEVAIKENNRIRYIELDQLFHRKMLLFANQNLLEQIFKEIYNLSLLTGHVAITKEGRMEEVIQEHKKIIYALENKETAAAQGYLKLHLEATGRHVKENFFI